jgi:MFS family permease
MAVIYTHFMSTTPGARALLRKRLLPLYIAIFLQGFVFWYSTEKLFMYSIGFDAASVGLMIAVYSIVLLLAETPSGILADRWSRKGVLILASIALAISAIIGGSSLNVPMFMLAASIWAIYYALYSGTYEAIIYDVLLEQNAHNR